MTSQFAREAKILRALSHPARLAILENLRHRPACVCHLTTALRRSQAYISQQLAILRDAGLIEGQRSGLFVYYRPRDYGILAVLDLVSRCSGRSPRSAPGGDERLEGCQCPQCQREVVFAKGAAQ